MTDRRHRYKIIRMGFIYAVKAILHILYNTKNVTEYRLGNQKCTLTWKKTLDEGASVFGETVKRTKHSASSLMTIVAVVTRNYIANLSKNTSDPIQSNPWMNPIHVQLWARGFGLAMPGLGLAPCGIVNITGRHALLVITKSHIANWYTEYRSFWTPTAWLTRNTLSIAWVNILTSFGARHNKPRPLLPPSECKQNLASYSCSATPISC